MATSTADLEAEGRDALILSFPERSIAERRRRYARRRLGVGTMVTVFVVLTAHLADAVAGGDRAPAPQSREGRSGRVAVVVPGQTLWDIAARYAPEQDPRAVVERLLDLNGLRGRALQAGTRIRIPD